MQAIASEFDGDARDALANVWGELKAVFGLPGMAGVTRPRAVFHAADAYDADAAGAALERVAQETPPFAAEPAGLRIYRGRRAVLALTLHREGAMAALHERLWRELEAAARGVREAYAAATWAPHITLAEGELAGAPLDVISDFLSGRAFAAPVAVASLSLLGGEAGGRALRSVRLGGVTSP